MCWGSAEDMKELNGPFDLVVASDCVYKQVKALKLLVHEALSY